MKLKRFILAALATATISSATVLAAPAQNHYGYDYFEKLMMYAANLYIDENVSYEELIDKALKKAIDDNPEFLQPLLKAGFASLDEYSEYYTPEEFTQYVDNLNNTFYGIGVVIQVVNDYIEVTSCIEDGSAIKAGVRAGDKIIEANGVSLYRKSLSEAQNAICGELGTDVKIKVLRGDEELTFSMKRAPVSTETVSYASLKGNIGLISISTFADKTANEFKDTLKFFDEKGITNIILDLRNNPGGYLSTVVDIAGTIVPKGIIVQTIYRQEEKNVTFYSRLDKPKYKFAVLVNENTASASEVLSSAIQDSKVGVLIGETTYGKGVIQDMYRIEDGGFKLTTGHYLTRNGASIDKRGIKPDFYVLNTRQPVDVSKYTPFDYKIKWKMGDNNDSVLAAKERLYRLGYYVGTLDKNFDYALHQAVTRFQADTGLYPYGVLDISTQVKIENVFYKTDEILDTQFETAYTYFGGKLEDLQKE